jgi:hypothetical protein
VSVHELFGAALRLLVIVAHYIHASLDVSVVTEGCRCNTPALAWRLQAGRTQPLAHTRTCLCLTRQAENCLSLGSRLELLGLFSQALCLSGQSLLKSIAVYYPASFWHLGKLRPLGMPKSSSWPRNPSTTFFLGARGTF